MLPTANSIELFCMRLAEAQRIIDINIKAQGYSVRVMTDENERLSMINASSKVDKNSAVIFGKKGQFETDSIKTIQYSSTIRSQIRFKGTNEIFGMRCSHILGVDNYSKKRPERLVASEGGNNELVNLNLMSYYARKAANSSMKSTA